MKHLRRILAVALPIVAAGAASAVQTPAVVNFAAAHPYDAGYVTIAAGAIYALVKRWTDAKASTPAVVPSSTGSSMGAQ